MGSIRHVYTDNEVFLGDLTEKEFYDRLHFTREHGHNRGQK